MDLVVLFGVVVVLTAVVYFLATLGTKETSFEEALAEQRQKRELENAQSKPEKQQKKVKVKKVKAKKDEAEPELAPTPATRPPPPVHQPGPLPQSSQKKEKKKDMKSEEGPRKINVEEVKVKAVKTEALKVQAAPAPALASASESSPASKDNKKDPRKEPKDNKKDTKEVKKEVKEGKKDAKDVKDVKEGKKDAKEIKKDAKEVKKDVKEVKDTKEIKKDTKEVKKDTKEVKKDAKEVKKDAKDVEKDSKEVKKDSKEVKKDVEEVKKDAKEVKKDIKEVPKEARESKKDSKEAKKDVKEVPKEAREPRKDKDPKKDVKDNKKEGKEEKKDNKNAKKEVKDTKKETKDSKKPAVESPVTAASVEVRETGVSEKQTPTQEKKKKKDKLKNDLANMNETKLLPLVQGAPLSETEIQTLIDILLNKQQQNDAGGDWVKKGRVDPITQLKRQLEDVENRLRDKDEAHSALSLKITDLCSDLHGERSKASRLKAQLDETVVNHARQQEIAINNVKAKHTSNLNELRITLEKEYEAKLQQQQKLIEQLRSASNESEETALKASLNEAKMQASVLQQNHETVSQQCQEYQEHISALEKQRAAEEATLNGQLADLQTQLQNSDGARAQALAQLAALERERETLTTQVSSYTANQAQIQQSLQEKVHEKAEVETRLVQVESDLRSVRQVVVDQNLQIERLKEEKESLASQSVRPAAEGQENGDVHSEGPHTFDTAHLQSLVKEKDMLIEEQVSEVTNLNKEIARLKEELENQREKNNEATGIVEEEKTKVRAVLRRIFPDVVVDDALDQGAFLSEFETKALQVATQTSQQQPPEPQVVEKIVEVVKVVEKEVLVEDPALKSRVEELTKENAKLRNQVTELEKTTSAADNSQRVSELEDEVRSVTEKVTHYQTVLADTENLLKSLQASVESEEVAWTKRLSEKETELKQLVADKANLQLQVRQLEDTLEKVKKAEDMQEQLGELKEQLKQEEKEKISLLEKLQKVQELQAQTATQGGGGSGDEASVLELKADNEKLRALVTVGQDASRQQEELIEQLQKELAATKTVSTNGPANEEQSQEGAGSTQ